MLWKKPVSKVTTAEFAAMMAEPWTFPGEEKIYQWPTQAEFWEHQALGKKTHWFLLGDSRPVSGERAMIRKVIYWFDPSDELSKLVSYRLMDQRLDPGEISKKLSDIIDIRIVPFVKAKHWGFDGTTYGVKFQQLTFNWWGEGQPEWKELIDRVNGIVTWLERKLKES